MFNGVRHLIAESFFSILRGHLRVCYHQECHCKRKIHCYLFGFCFHLLTLL